MSQSELTTVEFMNDLEFVSKCFYYLVFSLYSWEVFYKFKYCWIDPQKYVIVKDEIGANSPQLIQPLKVKNSRTKINLELGSEIRTSLDFEW